MGPEPFRMGTVMFYSPSGNVLGQAEVSPEGLYTATLSETGDAKVCFLLPWAMPGAEKHKEKMKDLDEAMKRQMRAQMLKKLEEVFKDKGKAPPTKQLEEMAEGFALYASPETTPFSLTLVSGDQEFDLPMTPQKKR
jgi:hypothetical protein